MTPSAVAIAAVCAYGISAGLRVELRNGSVVTAAGAFGPALVALGEHGYQRSSLAVLAPAALGCSLLAVLVTRQRLRALLAHVFGLGFSSACFAASAVAYEALRGREPDRPALLIATGVSSLAYAAFDAISAPNARSWRLTSVREQLGVVLPLHAVLASTAGLAIVALPRFGIWVFPVLLSPVIATSKEFGRFGSARRTFEETVQALGNLTEAAGYSPPGHQQRVAVMCEAVGRELGLSSHRVRRLELAALMHDVGAVSLPEPTDVSRAPAVLIAERSGDILRETGLLPAGGYAHANPFLAGSGVSDEAKILAMANLVDEAPKDPLSHLKLMVRPVEARDQAILQAFLVVLGRQQKSS